MTPPTSISTHLLFSVAAILSSSVADGERVYFGSTDGSVYALE